MDKLRYSRQISLPEIGEDGQRRLASARVLLVGAGGLGVPVLQYLAAAGVGTLGIADDDSVEWSNLQRQPIYREADAGSKKVACAARYVRERNGEIAVREHDLRVGPGNVRPLIRDYDLIVDGTDNLATRYGLNDACVLEDKPLVYGSVYRFEGQVSVFNSRNSDGSHGPNYRDLFPEPPPAELVPDCSEAGVMGALPGIMGALQALEAIKWITGAGEVLNGRLLIFDGLSMSTRTITIPDRHMRNEITSVIFSDSFCETADDRAAEKTEEDLSPEQLQTWITSGRPFTLVDVREQWERELVHIGGIHIPLNYITGHVTKHHEIIPGEIPVESPVVFYCRSGVRSKRAIEFCRKARARAGEQGAAHHENQPKIYHLEGGILAWREKINPDLLKY
ncbi:MAG: molybdopterin-synthase adenylyltransferase MoeB [Balneolaceae bacterium]|nr:MAG: molybdopterin-synthase adenylyltransferase MoeB [Balneolaceae bacterium]